LNGRFHDVGCIAEKSQCNCEQMLRQHWPHLHRSGLSALLTFTWSLMLHDARMAGSVKLQRSIEGCRERPVWAGSY